MSRYFELDLVAADFEHWSFRARSRRRRKHFGGVLAKVSLWLHRRRERQEFLDYLAADHRAAMDIGINRSTARDWAHRPFWQP